MRAKDEEIAIKNQLLEQLGQRQPKQEDSDLNPEELGIDPQTFQAVMKVAQKTVQKTVEPEARKLKSQLAFALNKTEAMEFLLNHGKDKAPYIAKIKAKQNEHFRATGGYLDMDSAFKMIRYDELMAQPSRGQSRNPNPQQPQPHAAHEADDDSGVPPADATRLQGGAAGPGKQSKAFNELSVDEQEAMLDERLKSGFAI